MPFSRAPGYKGALVFINRDVTNVLQRDEAEAFTVNSHVSSTYRHWFRNNSSGQNLSAGEDSTSDTTPDAEPVAAGDPSHERVNARGTTTRRLNGFRQGRLAPRRPQHEDFESSNHTFPNLWRESDQQQNIPQPPSPLTLLNTGNSDPFTAAATPLTAFHIELINNWQHRYYYYLTPLGASSTACHASALTWQSEVRQSISHDMLLHGIFAGALVFLSSHPSISPAELRRRSIFHQGQCLRLIRESIARGEVSPETLQAVAFAAVLDFFKRDIATCEVHVQAMKALTDFQGGLGTLPVATRPKLYLSDLEIADSNLRRMVFRVETWGLGDWDTVKPSLNSGSTSLDINPPFSHRTTLPTNLTPLLQHHREVLHVHALALTIAPQNAALADRIFTWLHTRKLTLIATTLDVYYDTMETSSPIEASLPLAINYAQRLIIDSRYENIVGIPLHNLRATLSPLAEDLLAVEDARARKSLLWILFVGACIEMLLKPTAPDSPQWFVPRFVALSRGMDIAIAEEAVFFEGFLYDDKALGWLLRGLMESTERSRDH